MAVFLLNIRLSQSVCVCLCVRKVYCGKTVKWIQMPFGMVSGDSRGMGVLDAVVIVEGVNLGRPIVMGTLLRSCAAVRKLIELSFGVVSGVG